jgi:hypothetical protein
VRSARRPATAGLPDPLEASMRKHSKGGIWPFVGLVLIGALIANASK